MRGLISAPDGSLYALAISDAAGATANARGALSPVFLPPKR
jgi:hypothetical protein